MTTITYNISIVGKAHSAEFQQATDSRNAVVAVDTSPLNGSLVEIEHKGQNDRLRFVRMESKSISGITIRSSSPDILITDIVHNGRPMWYKYQLRSEPFAIEDTTEWTKDDNWIYSSSPYINIQYGNAKLREIGVPVYIKESNHFLNGIKKLDNKTYSVSQDSSGEYIIRCKNQNVSFSSIHGEIATISEYTNPNNQYIGIFANEYSSDRIATIGGVKTKYRFQSPEFIASIVKTNKVKLPISDGIIRLPHKYINSVKSFDNKNIVYNQGIVLTNSTDSSIDIEYEYIEPVNNFTSIPIDIIRNASVVKVYTTPRSIIKGDAQDFLNTELLFSVFDKTGICTYSTISPVQKDIPSTIVISKDKITPVKYNAGKGKKESLEPRSIHTNPEEINKDFVLEIAEIQIKKLNLEYGVSGRRAMPITGSAGVRELRLPKLSYSRIVLSETEQESINSNVTVIDANMSSNIPTLIEDTDTDILVSVKLKEEETGIEFVDGDEGRFHRRNPPVFLGHNSKLSIVNSYNGYREILKEIKSKELDGFIYFRVKKSDYPIGRLTSEYIHLSKIPRG